MKILRNRWVQGLIAILVIIQGIFLVYTTMKSDQDAKTQDTSIQSSISSSELVD